MSCIGLAFVLLLGPCAMAVRSNSAATAAMTEEGEKPSFKSCNVLSRTGYKRYHYQVDTADGKTIAIELVRSAKNPRLRLYMNQLWSVAYYPDTRIIEWMPVKADENVTVSKTEISLKDTTWISYTDNNVGGSLRFMTTDLVPYSFTGGVYFPEELMLSALRPFSHRKFVPKDRQATDVQMAPYGKAAWTGLTEVAGTTSGGFGTGLAAGAGLGAAGTFLASGLLVTSWGVVAQATAIGALGGGAAGMVAGATAGLVVGLPVGLAKAAAKAVKNKREISLTMTKKIFEKMRCHPHFKSCPSEPNTFLLGIKKKACPARDEVPTVMDPTTDASDGPSDVLDMVEMD